MLSRRVPLQSRTPLRRTKPLRSRAAGIFGPGVPLKRSVGKHARLKPVSDKRRAENRQRRKMADEVFGPNPVCAVRWDDRCQGWAWDLHEPRKRSHGADITDAGQCVPVCRHCHGALHASPALAEKRGWLVRSGGAR